MSDAGDSSKGLLSPKALMSPATASLKGFGTPPSFAESQASARQLIQVDEIPPDVNHSELEMALAGSGSSAKGGEEMEALLPPDFSPYNAEYHQAANGNIVSHDKHLNEDGEALYRFLLQHASTPPTLLVTCHGSHEEWRTRTVSRYRDGKHVTETETYSETIIDFNFTIDASEAIIPSEPSGAPIWIVGDREAAHRGEYKREVDAAPRVVVDTHEGELVQDLEPGRGICNSKGWRRKATKEEKAASATWRERHFGWGYPPWALLRGQLRGTEASVECEPIRHRLEYSSHGNDHTPYDDSEISPPSKTLRDWADEYCTSKKLLKEFNFDKVVYGWNIDGLYSAIQGTLQSNYAHSNRPTITFRVEGDQICVKPDNWISRTLSKTWVLVLLWVTLIYPIFIWPFRRLSGRGGGEWRVAGSAFALTKWAPLHDSIPGETVEQYRERTSPKLIDVASSSAQVVIQPPKVLRATPRGVAELVGTREGEWFSKWEETIGSFVRQRFQSDEPVLMPLGSSLGTAGIGLDGYYPPNVRRVGF